MIGDGLALIFLGIGSVYDVRSRELPGIFLFIFAVIAAVCNLCFKYQSLAEIFSVSCLAGAFLCLDGSQTRQSVTGTASE